jgi:YkoY family integral membrane protein
MTSQELISGLWVIAGLIIIEGLLSVDNVLGIAALAKELPEFQQKKAIRLGLAGAYIFRVLALLVASWLIANTWVRWLGAGYLVWLMCSHLTRQIAPDDADGKGTVVRASLAAVLLQIGLMDLSLSIDNVIAAVGLAPKDPVTRLPVMWPIYVGVGIAILALQAIAPHAVKLLKKYPILEPAAFVLIGYVGGILIYEESYHLITGETAHLPPWFKFTGILLILWIALLYSADGSVRRLMRPVIVVGFPLMKLFSSAVALLFVPFTLLFSAFKPKPADIVD